MVSAPFKGQHGTKCSLDHGTGLKLHWSVINIWQERLLLYLQQIRLEQNFLRQHLEVVYPSPSFA